MLPPTGLRQGEVDGPLFGELFAKFRFHLRRSVTLGFDPRLTPWTTRGLPQITHQGVIEREVPLLPHFESPREILLEHAGRTGHPPYPI